MSYFIPTSGNWTTKISDPTEDRQWKILIDTDDDSVLEDVTSQLHNNTVSGGQRSGTAGAEWKVKLRNSSQTYQEGDLAGALCQIQARVATESWITVFDGYVSAEGCVRDKRSLTGDTVTIVMHDLIKTKATRRKTDPAIYSGYKICDTANTSSSLVHILAGMMGLSASDLDVTTIDHAVSHVALDGNSTAWKELQRIAEQYLANLYVRYDGKLRLVSRFETGFSEPTSEWTFYTSGENGNVHSPWSGRMRPKSCTRCETQYDDYEDLGAKTVYKNTDNWNSTTEQNEIVVAAGEYWPGPNAGDKARLKYRDPDTGEDYPLVTGVTTPTIGATGSDNEIECTGGLLTLTSFNGSTSATQQNPDSSEIILYNGTGSSITITKLELEASHAYRLKARNTVKEIDATVSDEDHVDLKIDGKYVSDQDQAHETCSYEVEWGKTDREHYKLTVDWLPQIQKGALVTLSIVEESRSIEGYVEEFTHVSQGPMTRSKTQLSIILKQEFTYSGTPTVVVDSVGDSRPHVDETDAAIARKARIFAQASEPTAENTGDLWIDTDNDNAVTRWDGASWVDVDRLQAEVIVETMLGKNAVTAEKLDPDCLASVEESLVAHWAMDQVYEEGGSYYVEDSSGEGYTATAASLTDSDEVTGKSGKAVDFDGTNDYMLASVDAAFRSVLNAKVWTVSFWAKPDSDSIQHMAFGGTTDSNTRFYFGAYNNNKWAAGVGNVSWTSFQGGTVTAGAWSHVVVTYDGTDSHLWVDGVLQDSATPTFGTSNTDAVMIGGYYLANAVSGSYRWGGLIDEVRIYSIVLTEAQIKFLYMLPSGTYGTMIDGVRLKNGAVQARHVSTEAIEANHLAISGGDAIAGKGDAITDNDELFISDFSAISTKGRYPEESVYSLAPAKLFDHLRNEYDNAFAKGWESDSWYTDVLGFWSAGENLVADQDVTNWTTSLASVSETDEYFDGLQWYRVTCDGTSTAYVRHDIALTSGNCSVTVRVRKGSGSGAGEDSRVSIYDFGGGGNQGIATIEWDTETVTGASATIYDAIWHSSSIVEVRFHLSATISGTPAVLFYPNLTEAANEYADISAVLVQETAWPEPFFPTVRPAASLWYRYEWDTTGDYIECFIRPRFDYDTAKNQWIVSDYDSGAPSGNAANIGVWYDASSDQLKFRITGASNTVTVSAGCNNSGAWSSSNTFASNTYLHDWIHFAFYFSSTSTITCWINGGIVDTDATDPGTLTFNPSLSIGSIPRYATPAGYEFNGEIADLRIGSSANHYSEDKPWVDDAAMGNEAHSFSLDRYSMRANQIEIAQVDRKGRFTRIGSAGLEQRDRSGQIIHDTIDSAVISGMRYLGHLYMFTAPSSFYSSEISDDSAASLYQTSSGVVNTDVSSVLPAGMGVARALQVFARYYIYCEDSRILSGSYLRTSFYAGVEYNSIGSDDRKFQLLRRYGFDAAAHFVLENSAVFAVPISYSGGTPYITTQHYINATGLDTSSGGGEVKAAAYLYAIGVWA